ncbi:hypothetical protein [Mucilaginibacter sp.]|uniref:hypothetical protein n=1 Tax=Mucilaginibacter sp. TaxID=1882438 RepID=UPI002628E495|nr:hypothetical protein [Mucilaginibacter sp.]MDB4925262.1 hypothetical protein [Mucilaginibacter sp.]
MYDKKTILVINDNSTAAIHAAEYAFLLAQNVNANIVLANTMASKESAVAISPASFNDEEILEEQRFSIIADHLLGINVSESGFRPGIKETDISNANECKLAELINRNKVWMIVKGTSAPVTEADEVQKLKVHIVLNKIACPLLLIPEHCPVKIIDRMIYISDLRYFRMEIIRYLVKLARVCKADLSVAHLTAKGLPDMSEEYALNIFTEDICRNVNYDRLFFNKIKEKDFTTAVDVMINGMQNDMLVFVNHHFHIEEILGGYDTKLHMPTITVPQLIFPY